MISINYKSWRALIVLSVACTMKKSIKNDKILNILKVKYRGNIWKKLKIWSILIVKYREKIDKNYNYKLAYLEYIFYKRWHTLKTPSEFYGDSIVCGWTRLSKPPFMYLPKSPGASFTRSISCIPEWIIKHDLA